MLAFAARQQVKTKYCSRITQAQRYLPHVWPIKTLDPDYLAPKQFARFGWVISIACVHRAFDASENQASAVRKTLI